MPNRIASLSLIPASVSVLFDSTDPAYTTSTDCRIINVALMALVEEVVVEVDVSSAWELTEPGPSSGVTSLRDFDVSHDLSLDHLIRLQ